MDHLQLIVHAAQPYPLSPLYFTARTAVPPCVPAYVYSGALGGGVCPVHHRTLRSTTDTACVRRCVWFGGCELSGRALWTPRGGTFTVSSYQRAYRYQRSHFTVFRYIDLP